MPSSRKLAFMAESRSRQLHGLALIFLILGAEGARNFEAIEVNAVPNLKARIETHAAADRVERRQAQVGKFFDADHVVSPEALLEEIVARDLAGGQTEGAHTSSRGVEGARGKLAYFKYSKTDVACFYPRGCYKEMFTILRQHPSEPGHALLDMYEDLNEEAFERGDPVEGAPYKSLLLASDSFVAVKKDMRGSPGLQMTGTVTRGSTSEDGQTMWLRLVSDRPAIKVKKAGSDQGWLSYDGHAKELAGAWLGLVKTLQALGTGLTAGKSFVQCTYVPKQGECATPDFCTLDKKTTGGWRLFAHTKQPTCNLKVGKAANLEAWSAFSTRAAANAAEVRKASCVSGCKSNWDQATKDLGVIQMMEKNLKEISDLSKLPGGMGEVANEILTKAPALRDGIIHDLSAGFDGSRNGIGSATQLGLSMKGCRNLTEGSMAALYRLSFSSAETEEAKAALAKDFDVYTQQCPWLKTLAAGSAEEQMGTLAKDSEDLDTATDVLSQKGDGQKLQTEKVDEQSVPTTLTMEDAMHGLQQVKDSDEDNGSLVQLQDGTAMDPITLAIVVCGVLILTGILLILLGSLFCKLGVWLTHRKARTGNDLCRYRAHEQQCYSFLNKLGCVMVIVGLIALIIILIVAMIAAASEGGGSGGGGGNYGGGGGGYHGGYHSGYMIGWWYTPPPYYYYGPHHSPYYGGTYSSPGLSDEERINFDYKRCMQKNADQWRDD